MSEEWVTVGSVDDVPEGETLLVEVAGEAICLYNLGGTICATQNVCTHGQASLAEGFIEGDCIECPMHQDVVAAMNCVPVAIVALITLCTPIIVFPLSYLVLKNQEGISLRTVVGGALTLCGIGFLILR